MEIFYKTKYNVKKDWIQYWINEYWLILKLTGFKMGITYITCLVKIGWQLAYIIIKKNTMLNIV